MVPRALNSAPERLVSPDGTVPFGTYAGPVPDINAGDFDYGKLAPLPFPLGIGGRAKRFKRWQFFGVIDDDFVLGVAIAHVQYLATGFAYLFDRRTQTLTECNIKRPFAKGTVFSPTAARGISEIAKGGHSIRSDNTDNGGERRVWVDFGAKLSADVTLIEPGTGVSALCPQDAHGFHYTYKSAGQLARGTVSVGGKECRLSDNALGLFDWTASTPPRATTWNWACAVGRGPHGQPVGINCSRGLVGGAYSQNTIWLDGAPCVLSGVQFDYDSEDILGKPWRVRTDDGLLDLGFRPGKERYENINVGLIASSLHQPFGTFTGTLIHFGTKFEVELYGFCEEHYAKW
jgi:hypothetical protein